MFYIVCPNILIDRLATILPCIISQEQYAPIKGMSIFENISRTQEMVYCINKPVRGGNIILKINMAKAYDSVNWEFLFHLLEGLVFLRWCVNCFNNVLQHLGFQL